LSNEGVCSCTEALTICPALTPAITWFAPDAVLSPSPKAFSA